ncbi:MAG: tagaturonate reductase, partial [Clostridia bacterium]|nr:tagaturonate reductase [Clostridia bacterium]
MERLSFQLAGKEPMPGKIRMLQFGEGNFLRAFVDEMVDNLNNQTGADVGVCIAQPLERGMVDMLRAQDHLYTVMLRGREEQGDVKKTRIVRSVVDSVKIYQEFDKFLSLAQSDDLRFIVSNTTEAGIVYTGKDNYDDKPQASFPGKVTRLLHERYLLKKKGFIFLPCEL